MATDLKSKLARLSAIQSAAASDQDKLDRINAIEVGGRGLDRQAVGTVSQKSPSLGSRLKHVGATALDALTVPQAALFTGVAKATGRDVDWSAAAGNFSRDDEGHSGLERALSSLGVDNKWAQLGIGIVADPLWFTGLGTVSKLGKAGELIADATKAGELVKEAPKALTGGRTAAERARLGRLFMGVSDRAPKTAPRVKSDAQLAAGIRAFTPGLDSRVAVGKTEAQRIAGIRAFAPRSAVTGAEERKQLLAQAVEHLQAARDLTVGKPIKVTLDNALGRASRRSGVEYGHKAVVSFKPTREAAKRWAVVARGAAKDRIKVDAFGTPLKAEKVFASKEEALRYVAQAARDAKMAGGKGPSAAALREAMGDVATPFKMSDVQKARMAKAFATKAKGVKPAKLPPLPKAVVDAVTKGGKIDKAKLAKALGGKAPAKKSEVFPLGAIDDLGRDKDYRAVLREIRRMHSDHLVRPPGTTLAVKLGAGKYSKMVSTGIKLPERSLRPRVLKGGYLALKPIEKIAHRLRDSGAETAEGVAANMMRLADRYGMTTVDEAGNKVIKKDEASMVGVFRSAMSVNRSFGQRIEKYFRERGVWEDRHSQLVANLDKRYQKLEEDLPSGIADRFQEKITTLKKANENLHVQADKMLREIVRDERRSTINRRSKILDEIAANERQIEKLKQRGPYTPQARSFKQTQQEREQFQKDVALGFKRPGHEFSAEGPAHLEEREIADNPFLTQKPDEFVEDMVSNGMKEGDARELQSIIDNELKRIDEPEMGAATAGHFVPEWDAMLLAGRREQTHVWKQVEDEIETLLNDSGILKDSDLYSAIQGTVRADGRARIGNTRVGKALMKAIAHLKGWFTFVNPSHFTGNFLGDFSNRNINGGFRHLLPFDAAPKNKYWQAANAETNVGQINNAALQKTFDIGGGRTMTGQELLALSRMVGLGRGYVGTDIAVLVDAFEHAGRGPKEWYRWAQRMNVKRENAQRLGTWVRHMQAGDDPITAQIKTLRVHFDYGELTDFEKLTMRNVLLFYTWLKRNTMLQGGGLVTRPGLYSAYADMENAREKFANEPDYFAGMGMIPTPFGTFSFPNPVADLKHYDLTMDNFRQSILGSVNPLIRVPTELAFNAKAFTGGRIQDYEGELSPSWAASALSAAGVPVNLTSVKEGGQKVPGINPKLAYVLSQIAGPQLSTIQTATAPDNETNPLAYIAGRLAGIRKVEDQPVKWKRSADYIARKRKADETRRKNAQEVR